jgi:hypothetical protein
MADEPTHFNKFKEDACQLETDNDPDQFQE